MMGRDDQERARDLTRLWQEAGVSVEDDGMESARRARVVPRIGDAILKAATRRRWERSTKRVAFVAAAAAVFAAFALGHYSERSPGRAVATMAGTMNSVSAHGSVTLTHGAEAHAIERAAFELGDSVSTGPEANAEIRLSNLVVAEVGSSSELSLMTPRTSTHRLRLDRGEIHAKVDDRPSPRPKLIVETPNAEVVVTGTIFEVDVTPAAMGTDATTVVTVTKGRIVVRRDGAEIAAVTAGQRWSSATMTARAPLVPPPAVAAPAPSAAPMKTRPTAAVVPHEAKEPEAAPAPATKDDVAGTLAEENRLFETAVEARNQGNDYEAITRLTELLDRYPSAPLASEARVERMRALERTGHVIEAAREARLYLSDFPHGFARAEAQSLVSQIDSN